ncbi:MAG: hypothetical protein BGO39_03445 [Chloroflexi bacterium 54-19]|nr:MAG: hypothetical protein BGO39_03445 [Chloroflexi bacterium 54-19]
MIYARSEIAGAVEQFWDSEFPAEYPCDIIEAVSYNLDVSLEFIPDLTVAKVADWMRRKKIPAGATLSNRRLYGCLVAVQGIGFILVDENASPEEQRFTAAHEVGHYLFDYLYPRKEALEKLGEGVMETLNGLRQATLSERQAAVLSGLKLDMFFSLMERSGDGAASFETHCSETRADDFALELLAPASRITGLLDFSGFGRHSTFEQRLAATRASLINEFGLPEGIAERYATHLLELAGYGPTAFDSFLKF